MTLPKWVVFAGAPLAVIGAFTCVMAALYLAGLMPDGW